MYHKKAGHGVINTIRLEGEKVWMLANEKQSAVPSEKWSLRFLRTTGNDKFLIEQRKTTIIAIFNSRFFFTKKVVCFERMTRAF